MKWPYTLPPSEFYKESIIVGDKSDGHGGHYIWTTPDLVKTMTDTEKLFWLSTDLYVKVDYPAAATANFPVREMYDQDEAAYIGYNYFIFSFAYFLKSTDSAFSQKYRVLF